MGQAARVRRVRVVARHRLSILLSGYFLGLSCSRSGDEKCMNLVAQRDLVPATRAQKLLNRWACCYAAPMVSSAFLEHSIQTLTEIRYNLTTNDSGETRSFISPALRGISTKLYFLHTAVDDCDTHIRETGRFG